MEIFNDRISKYWDTANLISISGKFIRHTIDLTLINYPFDNKLGNKKNTFVRTPLQNARK